MSDQQVREYIRQNRGRYTDDALRQQLLAAGHPPELVDQAFAEIPLVPEEPTVSRRPHALAVLVVAYLAVAVLTSAIIVSPYGFARPRDIWQGLPVLLIYFLPALLIGLLLVGLWPGLGRVTRDQALTTMTAALAVPVVILVGMAGFCVVVVGP